jgi:predicted metal-dependent phosphoesterase TrpH
LRCPWPLSTTRRTPDIIAAFIEREIQARELETFVCEVREQNGLLLLPHPFAHHRDVASIAEHCDLIETFNPRVDESANHKARELALRLGKPGFSGADAHFPWSVGQTVVSLERRGTLQESLLHGDIEAAREQSSLWVEVIASQYIKAVKKKDRRLALRLFREMLITGIVRGRMLGRI